MMQPPTPPPQSSPIPSQPQPRPFLIRLYSSHDCRGAYADLRVVVVRRSNCWYSLPIMSSWPLELRRAGRGDMECDPLRHFPTVVAFEEYIKQRLLYPGTSILAIEQTHVSEPRFFTNFFPSAITILKSNKIARDLLLVSPTSALGASIIGNLSHTDQSNQPHLLGILLLGDNLVNPNPTPYPPTMRPSHPSPAPINPQPVAITCGPMPNPSTLKQSESSSDPLPDRPSQLPSKRPNDNDMEEEGAPAQSKARLSSEPDTRDGDSKATESHDPGPTLPKPIAIKQEKTDGTDEHSPIRTMKLLGNTSNLSVTTRVIPLKMVSSPSQKISFSECSTWFDPRAPTNHISFFRVCLSLPAAILGNGISASFSSPWPTDQ